MLFSCSIFSANNSFILLKNFVSFEINELSPLLIIIVQQKTLNLILINLKCL
jgi:hypothetical protein